jgi:flavin reductase (DIM6/NTAB) family NADH-FMN oxidoreductase RutF
MADDRSTDAYAAAKAALSTLSMPVAIIAAASEGERSCATGTVTYVSLAPVQVAIAMHPGSRTCRLARASRSYSISILAAEQLDIAMQAGRGGRTTDKLAELGLPALEPPPERDFDAPGIDGSLAVLWCRILDELVTGDHVLLIGSVEGHVRPGGGGISMPKPLVRYDHRYIALDPSEGEAATDSYPI